MKRRVGKVALFLLLGAIINVAMAWGCALWSVGAVSGMGTPIGPEYRTSVAQIDMTGTCVEYHTFGLELETWHDVFHAGPMKTSWQFNETPVVVSVDPLFNVSESPTRLRAGWPTAALVCYFPIPEFGGDSSSLREVVDYGIQLKRSFARRLSAYHRRLPLRATWPGFAINTIFYAAILWLLFALPFTARRRRWTKRGLCTACGYPVGTSALCTECGKPVRQRQRSAMPRSTSGETRT